MGLSHKQYLGQSVSYIVFLGQPEDWFYRTWPELRNSTHGDSGYRCCFHTAEVIQRPVISDELPALPLLQHQQHSLHGSDVQPCSPSCQPWEPWGDDRFSDSVVSFFQSNGHAASWWISGSSLIHLFLSMHARYRRVALSKCLLAYHYFLLGQDRAKTQIN